jgi:DNA (cytosine-5)-methyltransferase 1
MGGSSKHRPFRSRRLRVAGLFAGVGGLELGLARSGHQTVLLCEKDDAAASVLHRRFPNVRVSSDIRELEQLPRGIDLVAAGFPCQDLSQAGMTAGLRGTRSGLVREVFRLLERRRVPWVLFENVPFLLHVKHGASLRALLGRLERLGYRWAYRVVDSRAFGVPQRRQRIFILASLLGDPRDVLLADDSKPDEASPDQSRVACGFYWTEGNKGTGWAVDCVPALKGGSAFGIPSPPAIILPSGAIITPDIRDAERMQGLPVDWTRPALNVRGRHRWRLVGNAVTVGASTWIGRRLSVPGSYDSADDWPVGIDEPAPPAAWNVGEGMHGSLVSAWPKSFKTKPLATFLRFEGQTLSARAARGFLNRLEATNLRKPERLVSALESMLDKADSA